MCFAPQRRALFQHLNLQKWSETLVFLTFWLGYVLRATTACTFSTAQLPKVVRPWCVLYILTSKCASRHNGVHFFDISTDKSGPELVVCFVHFDFEMLRATTACTFSTSQLPKVVREWCVLYILTSKCASRHNGVQFFISHLASWLRTRRFSEPTFRPSGAPHHWKNTVFRDFPTFSRICIFFLLTRLSSNLSLLSASSLLCISSVHIIGSWTSKLPSMKENLDTRSFFLGPQIRQTHDIVSKLDYVFQNGTWLVATGRDFDDDHAYLLCRWCLHALASHLRETSAGVHEMCTKEEPGAQTKANASRWPFHKARDGKPDSFETRKWTKWSATWGTLNSVGAATIHTVDPWRKAVY